MDMEHEWKRYRTCSAAQFWQLVVTLLIWFLSLLNRTYRRVAVFLGQSEMAWPAPCRSFHEQISRPCHGTELLDSLHCLHLDAGNKILACFWNSEVNTRETKYNNFLGVVATFPHSRWWPCEVENNVVKALPRRMYLVYRCGNLWRLD